MRLSAYQVCPPEVISYICGLACADDGRTVRALSLVSRYFQEISLPFLYQSLLIVGCSKISTLASKLEATPSHLRPVHHLFISTHSLGDESIAVTCTIDSASILRVLLLSAPTLETLSFVSAFHAQGTPAISQLFRISFPRLRELTVSGLYPFPSSPGKMPSLERLHLHGNRNPHGLLQLGVLDEACPSLTHLRVSGLSMAASFTLELQEAFSGIAKPPFPSKLPPRVRNIVLQPGPPLPTSQKSTAWQARDELMMEHLKSLKPPKSIQFSVLPRAAKNQSHESFRNEWIERLNSGYPL